MLAPMTRSTTSVVALLLALALLAAGCGSSGGGSSSTTPQSTPGTPAQTDTDADQGTVTGKDSGDQDAASGDEGARTPCKAKATRKPTGLPAAFPVPGELVLTQAQSDGPTKVVDGYWTADIDEALREYHDQVGEAGYVILHQEHDAHDAEINYKGSKRTGQIALRDDCTEAHTTRVHITNRPS